MTNVLFTALFILVPLGGLLLARLSGITMRHFSLPSFFLIAYLASAYAGILPLYFEWDRYSLSIGVTNKTIIFSMFAFSSLALFTVACGFLFARRILRLKASIVHEPTAPSTSKQRLFIYGLFLVCAGVLVVYLRKVETVALFKALEGDYYGAAIARSDMGNNFSGKYWRYQFFFRYLLDYCVLFLFVDLMLRRKVTAFLAFIVAFTTAFVSAVMAIEKGPLVNLLVMMFLAYVMLRGSKYWQPGTKYALALVVSVLVLFYMYFMRAPDIGRALKEASLRVTLGQITPAYFYIDLFPERLPYLWGASLPNPGGVLPFEPFPLTVTVSRFMYPTEEMRGVVGSAPTVFWGEMYVNFGPLGVVLSAFLVGVGLFIIGHMLGRMPRSVPVVAATAFLAMHYRTLTATSLSNYMYDFVLLAIASITGMLLLLQAKRWRYGAPRLALSGPPPQQTALSP